MSYIFVGERRSPLAIKMAVTWQDGRLAAKTLHEALISTGLDPKSQHYINIFQDGDGAPCIDCRALAWLHKATKQNMPIVGMGRLVQRALDRANIPHLKMIHPAARGAIRAKDKYHAHVAAVLGRIEQ